MYHQQKPSTYLFIVHSHFIKIPFSYQSYKVVPPSDVSWCLNHVSTDISTRNHGYWSYENQFSTLWGTTLYVWDPDAIANSAEHFLCIEDFGTVGRKEDPPEPVSPSGANSEDLGLGTGTEVILANLGMDHTIMFWVNLNDFTINWWFIREILPFYCLNSG